MKKLFILFALVVSMLTANIDKAKEIYYTKDFKKAFLMFQQLSKEGNIESNYYLGNMYQYGNGVEKNYKKAFEHYTVASNISNEKSLKSKFHIAIMYMNGQGVKKDPKKVFSLLKEKEFNNRGVAQYILGVMHEEGQGVSKDFSKAILFYEKGCNTKKLYPKACYDAGNYYENGIGVDKDYETAKKYYEKACKAGIEESCEALKNMKEPLSFYERYQHFIVFSLLLLAFWRLWRKKKREGLLDEKQDTLK